MTMDHGALVRALYARRRRAFAAKPGHARATGACTARLDERFACTTSSGPHEIVADLPQAEGGADAGPTPGQLMRSGLAACLAVGYRLWAHRLGVGFDEIEVELACELDARGQLGVEGVPVGWQRIAWTVRVATTASDDEVRRVVDTADRLSPMLASLDRAIARARTVRVVRRAA
jgi:uncharacterized OsmC-like protein